MKIKTIVNVLLRKCEEVKIMDKRNKNVKIQTSTIINLWINFYFRFIMNIINSIETNREKQKEFENTHRHRHTNNSNKYI